MRGASIQRPITMSAALMRENLKVLELCLVAMDRKSPFRTDLVRRIQELIRQLERRRDGLAAKGEGGPQ